MKKLLLGLVLLGGAVVAFDYGAPHQAARVGLALELARVGLEPKGTTIPGFDIAYLEGGQGEPLVLIHGFGAASDNFIRVAAYLTPHYRVLIPDLPGFGASSKPADASYAVAEQAERVRAFVQQIGLKRVHLGGSSMGGHIAAEYALRHPDEVASLWLLGPAGMSAAYDSELRRLYAREGRNPLLAKTADEFPAIMQFTMSRHPFVPHSVTRVMGERAAANHALHARIFEQLSKPSAVTLLDERIKGLATPALVVWGKEDRALNPKAADSYKAAMPNVQIVLMDGIGHLPMIEAPEQAALDFLEFRRKPATPAAGT